MNSFEPCQTNHTELFKQLSLSQRAELQVQNSIAGAYSLRYAYARSDEAIRVNDTGQDYLTFRSNGQSLAFALCDGVSQSFFGDLAACFLGERLVEWLWQQGGTEITSEIFEAELSEYLNHLSIEATSLVSRQSLPANLPHLLREVLEAKQAQGSETTFVCGWVQPVPGKQAFLAKLAWMGDSRLRLWSHQTEITGLLGASFHTAERWSTRRGVVGKKSPHVWLSANPVTRLVAYSDGLSYLDNFQPAEFSDNKLNELIMQLRGSATSDDISFLEIWPTQASC